MGFRGVFILLILLTCACAAPLYAQVQPPSEQLTLTAKSASTWTDGQTNVVLLRGPVKVVVDRATLSADDAVVWLSADSPDNFSIQNAQIALLGHAKLQQAGITRSGNQLFVTDQVRGEKIRIEADERVARNDSQDELFKRAAKLRAAEQPVAQTQTATPTTVRSSTITRPPVRPTTAPTTKKKTEEPVFFEAQNLQTLNADDGNVVVVLEGGVRLLQRQADNDLIELSADRAVLYTPLKSMKEFQKSGGKRQGRDTITAAYLEGDVRIDYSGVRKGVPEQRLTANRVYYEFATDRAVLTDAVVHTIEPQRGTSIVLRANLVRQLAKSEFSTVCSKLTNSYFAVPSYCLAAERLYMRAEPTGDPRIGDLIVYDAEDLTFQAFNLPFFYYPHAAGEMTQHGFPLRGIGGGTDRDFGTFAESVWGLFETLGKIPPRDLDANFRLDYFSDRGPATGLNAAYGGGSVTDSTRQPYDFDGTLKSYVVYDKGQDFLGGARANEHVVDDYTLRGQVLLEHQHFFPDDWQAQIRLGYVSDATFMEQWFRNDFEEGPPHDVMGYLKHQTDSQAFTFGATYQPSKLVTTADFQQEQFEVERLPQVGYYDEGNALLGDRLTLFSENTVAGLHYALSRDSLLQQGFNPQLGVPPNNVTPGLPAEGYTGIARQIIWRGDFRQQLDFPFTAGPLRVDPYVMGRLTAYSSSPQTDERTRLMAGAGTRITTELWKVDPSAESDLLDIHQLRHVIEPEVNLFTSAMNVQRDQVYVYEQQTDAINDISGAQFALHQRWETKRGGPGEWRSVDLVTLNVEVDGFVNKPSKLLNNPGDFRGQFFSSYPEESIPRDAVNANGSVRISDNTVIIGEMAYNLDRGSLQTLGLGILVRRDTRLSYFIGNEYIAKLDSNITSIHADYEFTTKYLFSLDQEFDFTLGKNVSSSVAIIRRFDTFFMSLRYAFDETTHQGGVSFNLYPAGLGYGLDTSSFNTFRR